LYGCYYSCFISGPTRASRGSLIHLRSLRSKTRNRMNSAIFLVSFAWPNLLMCRFTKIWSDEIAEEAEPTKGFKENLVHCTLWAIIWNHLEYEIPWPHGFTPLKICCRYKKK
jgi:hypothetical protein